MFLWKATQDLSVSKGIPDLVYTCTMFIALRLRIALYKYQCSVMYICHTLHLSVAECVALLARSRLLQQVVGSDPGASNVSFLFFCCRRPVDSATARQSANNAFELLSSIVIIAHVGVCQRFQPCKSAHLTEDRRIEALMWHPSMDGGIQACRAPSRYAGRYLSMHGAILACKAHF